MIGKNQCQHGSLARVCEVCELQAENKRLREALEEIIVIRTESHDMYLVAQAALKEPDAEKQRKGLNNPNRSSGEVMEVQGCNCTAHDDYHRQLCMCKCHLEHR